MAKNPFAVLIAVSKNQMREPEMESYGILYFSLNT